MRKVYTSPAGEKQYKRPECIVVKTTKRKPYIYIYSPSDEQMVAAGWTIEEIIDPIPEPYIPTYAELVEQYIREHGYPTYGAELAVLNNYATDPTTYADAFAAYQQTRKDAKAWADTQPHRAEEGGLL